MSAGGFVFQMALVATATTVIVAGVAAVVTATAAGEEDDGKNDQPNPVIVEKIAQTVVHNRFLRENSEEQRPNRSFIAPLLSEYAKDGGMCVRFVEKRGETNADCIELTSKGLLFDLFKRAGVVDKHREQTNREGERAFL